MQSLTNKIIALKFKDNTKIVGSASQQKPVLPTQSSSEKYLSQHKQISAEDMFTGFLIW